MGITTIIIILIINFNVFGQPVSSEKYETKFKLYDNGQIVDFENSSNFNFSNYSCVDNVRYNQVDSFFIVSGTIVKCSCILPTIKISKNDKSMIIEGVGSFDSLTFKEGNFTFLLYSNHNTLFSKEDVEKIYDTTQTTILLDNQKYYLLYLDNPSENMKWLSFKSFGNNYSVNEDILRKDLSRNNIYPIWTGQRINYKKGDSMKGILIKVKETEVLKAMSLGFKKK